MFGEQHMISCTIILTTLVITFPPDSPHPGIITSIVFERLLPRFHSQGDSDCNPDLAYGMSKELSCVTHFFPFMFGFPSGVLADKNTIILFYYFNK